ncbi:MAG: GAF domain-containing protein [Bacteroidales bacterium]|nr:GAF domain-containing protein [Bacteroidales bacterium]
MKKFEKGQKYIDILLVVWIIISLIVSISIFSSRFQSYLVYISLGYIFLSICVAIIAFLYAKSMFKKANILEDKVGFDNNEIKQQDQQEQNNQNKLLAEQRETEEKKLITHIVDQISSDLETTQDLNEYFEKMLNNMSNIMAIVQGVAYAFNKKNERFEIKGTYAYYSTETNRTFVLGEGITGQVAKDKKILLIDNVPQDYVLVQSGLGQGSPKYLIVIPFVYKNETVAVLELATFEKKNYNLKKLFEKLNSRFAENIAKQIAS